MSASNAVNAKIVYSSANNNLEFKFSDGDLINHGDIDYHDNIYLIHEHGQVICLVYADDDSEALDIAADEDKLEAYRVDPDDYEDNEFNKENFTSLGNDCCIYDIESIEIIQLPKLELSYVATLKEFIAFEKQASRV